MFCPQCGQQQVSEGARFCARCGFQLGAVSGLLASGGVPLGYAGPPAELAPPSPRRRGAQFGGKLMLTGLFLMPVLAIMSEVLGSPDELPLVGLLIFMAGLFRLLYALLFEDGPFRRQPARQTGYVPPGQFAPPAAASALPPPQGVHARGYVPPRADTSDLAYRPSVTEGPTRMLDRERDDAAR
ncbi:MAG TPA: zinc ribbon domain-containing protein [Pyrinomonadaceae bacterium]|jgi:hypothetical protein